MKKLFTLLATVTLSVMLFAQAPQSFSYQTVIRDASWQVLSNQNISLEISIIEDVANGTAIYTESHSATTNELGLVNLSIGDGGVMSGSWSNIDWGNHTYFIEVAVDVTGGTSYIVMGTTQLRSVPYALYAETSGSSTPGPQGATGATGPQGPIGLTGPAGANGIDGADGQDGADGATGPIGLTGATGPAGNDGADGNDGAVGATGPPGNDGADGTNGIDGAVGATGPQGNDGADGQDGADGATGPIGLTGATGPAGANGIDGTNGVDGATGAIGLTGATGPQGSDGADGTNGIDGAVGATGPPGNDGYTPMFGVDYFNGADGVDGTNGVDGIDGIDGIDAVVDYDSLANIISVDSIFITTVIGGLDSITSNSQPVGNDFEDDNPNNDFNTNIIDQIPQGLDGQTLIFYSTDNNIYITDSVGSFTSIIYSVQANYISNLTSNENGDTLYFLQYSGNSMATPTIMMTSVNNFNPVAVGTLPCTRNEVKQFKYINGSFYYNKNHNLLKITNGNIQPIIHPNECASFTVSNTGTEYISLEQSGGNNIIMGTNYSHCCWEFAKDIDVSESENRIYMWKYNNGGVISYWDLSNDTETILYDPQGTVAYTNNIREQVVKFHENKVYFNEGSSIFSVENNGNNSLVISSSQDNSSVNGIVPFNFTYQAVNDSNTTVMNINDFILSNNKKIFYSTDFNIYLTDSVGSFTSAIYSVQANYISNLTSNENGDTLYFLQYGSASATPTIMMTSVNNFNPVAVGTLPCTRNEVKQFKYINGSFYYNKNHNLLKITNGNIQPIIHPNECASFTVSNTGTEYISLEQSGGNSIIMGTNYSHCCWEFAKDIDVSESENRIYMWKYNNGGVISYWDLSNDTETILYDPQGTVAYTNNIREQVVKFHENKVYFNEGSSIFSVENNGNNPLVISSSQDNSSVNGIAVVD